MKEKIKTAGEAREVSVMELEGIWWKGIKLGKEEFTDLLYKISHDLEHYECWVCIASALESEIEDYIKKE